MHIRSTPLPPCQNPVVVDYRHTYRAVIFYWLIKICQSGDYRQSMVRSNSLPSHQWIIKLCQSTHGHHSKRRIVYISVRSARGRATGCTWLSNSLRRNQHAITVWNLMPTDTCPRLSRQNIMEKRGCAVAIWVARRYTALALRASTPSLSQLGSSPPLILSSFGLKF